MYGRAMSMTAPDVGFVAAADAPWVQAGDGAELKVFRVDLDRGLWVIANRFAPGFSTPMHRHTGEVNAFTLSGSWLYDEYGVHYGPGSYVYEPANSVHTLRVPESNTEVTEVIFTIDGALVYVTPDGTVLGIADGAGTLAFYLAMCEQQGHGTPGTLR
jgi:quercetin dioxygenase-like cupin family protein